MDKQKELAAIFKELSPENQGTLLVYARLSQVAEQAVRRGADRLSAPEYLSPSMRGAHQCKKTR